MDNIVLEWADFKTDIIARGYPVNYRKTYLVGDSESFNYEVFAVDRSLLWITYISDPTDKTDFETNYKNEANKPAELQSIKRGSIITGMATVTGTGQIIVEYTVPSGKTIFITDIIVGGSVIDRKVAKADGTAGWRAYHIANNSVPHSFQVPLKVSAGVTVSVQNEVATSGTHVATISGVIIDAII